MRRSFLWQWSADPDLSHGGSTLLGCAACNAHTCFMCLGRVQPSPTSISGWFCSKGCPSFGVGFVSPAGLVSLGMPRGKEWSQVAWPTAPQVSLASPLSPLDCDVGVLPKSHGLLVSQTWINVGKEMMFLRRSLCSLDQPPFWLLREKTQPVTCLILKGYSQVRWISTSARLVHDSFKRATEQRHIGKLQHNFLDLYI